LTLPEAADLLRIDVAEVERLAERKEIPGRRIGESWRFSCAALIAWLNGDSFNVDLPDVKPTETTPGQAAKAEPAGAPTPGGQDTPIGEAPKARPADDIFLRGQRVLLGRGEAVVDFGQFYARSRDYQLASINGAVGLATVERRLLTTLLVGRVGIFEETELFASTTFNNLDSRLFLGTTNLAGSGRSAVGATAAGIRRTLFRERVGRPDVIVAINGQMPTGDASAAVGGGLVLVKSIDPVVLFANTNYAHTFRRSGVTRVEPENSVDLSMGYGLGLNDSVAISMAVSGLFAGTTTVDNATLRSSALISGRFGLTMSLAEGLYIEPSVSFGLSGPGTSFAFGVTMPYRF